MLFFISVHECDEAVGKRCEGVPALYRLVLWLCFTCLTDAHTHVCTKEFNQTMLENRRAQIW